MTHRNAHIARELLAGGWMARLIDADGVPTGECWARAESGTLSSGELVLLAIALELVDYRMPREVAPPVGALFGLDTDSLRRVAAALGSIAGNRHGR